jgi:hypothetical protein
MMAAVAAAAITVAGAALQMLHPALAAVATLTRRLSPLLPLPQEVTQPLQTQKVYYLLATQLAKQTSLGRHKMATPALCI